MTAMQSHEAEIIDCEIPPADVPCAICWREEETPESEMRFTLLTPTGLRYIDVCDDPRHEYAIEEDPGQLVEDSTALDPDMLALELEVELAMDAAYFSNLGDSE